LFSACVPPVPGVRSDSKEVCARHEVGMSFARADVRDPTETEVRAHEGAHRGRSPQGVGRRRGRRRSLRRARRACRLPAGPRRLEVTRTLGETVPRASLGGGERRRPRSAPGSEALAAAGESVVDVPPKLSARVRVLSTGNARKNDGLDALATALAASRNERLSTVDPDRGCLGGAAPAFREARRPGG
jgi:hypothetical protein